MADAWGIESDYIDAQERPASSNPDSIRALREIIGTPPDDLDARAPLVVHPTDARPAGEIELEGGGEVGAGQRLPLGYHTLHGRDGTTRPLIVSPGTCVAPPARMWGWALQLYAARSAHSWGMGDLADLRRLVRWSRRQDAGFVLVNPLHAAGPTLPQQASPYFPASREFRSPLYLSVPELDSTFTEIPSGVGNTGAVIDRDAVWTAKRAALRAIFDRGPDDAFGSWRRDQGVSLQSWATWCVLAETHDGPWRDWPQELRRPDTDGVRRFAAGHEADVSFHAWLQYQLTRQLSDATAGTTVLQDLPIGVDPDGADAWIWQDVLAPGVAVGAPPDPFNLAGQDWGLPPFVPWKLREAGYQPFIDAIRQTTGAGGGLRIDHVMGLFRLWWVPPGGTSADGAYVRYPAEDLLDIVALESHRANALVVGEDLGTVEDGVRETLAARNVLSYRLFWFEDDAPSAWPTRAMAALSTHDLPTVAGVWAGHDLDDQRSSGVEADAEATTQLRDRIVEATGLDGDTPVVEVIEQTYAALASAPCVLLSATLDDAVGAERRPNMPGTTTRDNWSIPLPVSIEDLPPEPAIAVALRDGISDSGTTGRATSR